MSDALVALRVHNASKTFGATAALSNVSIDIAPGQVHALMGQNGSGKSTLIKLLGGLHKPDDDVTFECCGQAVKLGDGAAAHAAGLRFVHQDLGLVGSLDAYDNMALGHGYSTRRIGRINWRAQKMQVRTALESLGYHIKASRPIDQLAPVERTAIAIARALQGLEGRSVLVMDEPTATMPNREVERLFTTIRHLRDRGVAILYVSHHVDEVYSIADAITVLRDGRVVESRQTAELPRADLLKHLVVASGQAASAAPASVERPVSDRSDRSPLDVVDLSAERLDRVSFNVRKGEVLGVAGITGSGREEMCSAVFGAQPRTGRVFIDGRPVEPMRPRESVNAGAGLVPANRRADALFEEMTVRENLTAPDVSEFWRGAQLRRRAERRATRALIERFGIKTESSELAVGALSGGNQQKVVVGRWLRLRPRILLLDDPTQGVDVGAKRELHQLIRTAAQEGMSFLVCSTDEGELADLCDRVLVLRRGRIADELSGDDLTAERVADQTFGSAPDQE